MVRDLFGIERKRWRLRYGWNCFGGVVFCASQYAVRNWCISRLCQFCRGGLSNRNNRTSFSFLGGNDCNFGDRLPNGERRRPETERSR